MVYNMTEEWRVINEYPNYEISNMGNIRNIKTNRILKQKLQNGYCCITLPPLKKGFKIHSHIIKGDYIHLDQDIMIVNHYNVQSLEFYITVKMTRGDSNNYIKRNLKIFKWNDINNIIDTKLYEQNKNMINDIKEKNNKITILYDSKNIINFENDINLIDKYIHKYDQCLIYNYGSSANFIYKPKIKYVNINNIDYYLYNRNIIECDSLTIDILLK